MLVLACCTTINIIDPHTSIRTYQDSTLVPYIKRFKEEAQLRQVELDKRPFSVLFGSNIGRADGDNDTVGECSSRPNEIVIVIDRDYWNSVKEASREELMFHELGHGLLRRHEHCDTTMEVDGKQQRLSMMSAYMGDPDDYLTRRDQLIDELFEPDERCKESDEKAPAGNSSSRERDLEVTTQLPSVLEGVSRVGISYPPF